MDGQQLLCSYSWSWLCNIITQWEEVLDRSAQPDMAGKYKKALAARMLLNVKDMHSNRHLYGRTTQFLAQIEKVWRRRLCSSLERIIEAKSN
jgi:hypothetical protein